MRKSLIYCLLMVVTVCAIAMNDLSVVHAEGEVAPNDIGNKLVPLPRQIDSHDGTLQMTEQVNILGRDSADKDAIRILEDFLKEKGIEINDEFDMASTTIALGEEGNLEAEVKDLERELDLPAVNEEKAASYLLAVSSKSNDLNEGGTIVLKGVDGSGTFYAVKTMIQLADETDGSLTFKNAVIEDAPSMGVRGIIEGFYGNPWSHSDRLDQIRFYGDYKMNTYIYAPKDDPYHREKWRSPYPEEELDRMNELIDTAKENKVDFVFAISPGIDIRFDGQAGEEDFEALLLKSESLYEMGVRRFAILFDDINNKDGKKQAQLLNRFNEEFIKNKKDVKPLITVPTEYDNHAMGAIDNLNTYTKAFSTTLDQDIIVMWTGQAVVSEKLPVEDVDFMREIYGDRIGIWWNYPVTDYLQSKLALGPIVDIDTGLEGKLDFFTMNPMEHANLSKISLATGADYSWNTPEYDADRSWNRSIELLFEDLAPEMKTFAKHSSRMIGSWSIGREDAEDVREMMDQLWQKLAKKQDVTTEIDALNQAFTEMIEASDTLKEKLPSKILNESSKNLDKLKQLGESGIIALDLILAKNNGDEDQYNEAKAKLESNLPSLEKGARVSEKTVLAFIKEAIDYDPLPVVSFETSKSLVAPGEEIEFKNTSSLTTIDLEWTFEGANIEESTEENPKVTYEEEGIYTVKLVGKNSLGEDEVIKEGLITVSELAKEDTVNLALGQDTTASSVCASSEAGEFAVDGSLGTKWCANGSGTHTLTVDLGGINAVSEFVIKHAEEGGEPAGGNTRAYRVQISEDGENFKELVKVRGNESGITKNQVLVTKGRYVRLIIDKPTQGDDNAARIYEFEVKGLAGDVELPPKYDPEDPQPVESADELKALVERMLDEGAIDTKAAHSLTVHLEAVSHYEGKGSADKVVKHMEGFKSLLEHQKGQGLIDEEAYNSLHSNADYLIDRWR